MNQMKKTMIFFLLMLISATGIYAQVTVGDDTPPAATLDVVANDSSTPAGVIAPRLTLTQLKSADDKYEAAQTGAIVYVTNANGTTTTKTAKVTTIGYYYFDGLVWQAMTPAATEPWYEGGTTNQATTNTQDIYQSAWVGLIGGAKPATPFTPKSALDVLNNAGGSSDDDIIVRSYSATGTPAAPRLIFSAAHGTVDAPANLTNGEPMGDITWKSLPNFPNTDNVKIAAYYNGNGTNNLGSMRFLTGATHRMVIDSAGNVGINTLNPTTKLEVNAGNNPGTGFKMTDGTQGAGKILMSDANGIGTWAIQNGSLLQSNAWDPVNATQPVPTDIDAPIYTGLSTTLPPGKYMMFVQVGFTVLPGTVLHPYIGWGKTPGKYERPAPVGDQLATNQFIEHSYIPANVITQNFFYFPKQATFIVDLTEETGNTTIYINAHRLTRVYVDGTVDVPANVILSQYSDQYYLNAISVR